MKSLKDKIIPSKMKNFSHTCQNISNELLFDRMILKTFNINTSNYWKLSKIWVMSKLKNPTLNSISVWVHHSRIITLWELRKEVSCLSIFLAWFAWANDELSQLIFWELSSRLGHVWLKCNWKKPFCYKLSNWAQFCQRDKICQINF